MNDNIPGLKIEANDDNTITLEQDWCGNVDRVAIHAVHIRHLAERLGLLKVLTTSEAEQRRDIDRLKRNMLRVREHALQLQTKFANGADWDHADLTYEMGLINALVDLLDMAVDDFADDYTAHDPAPLTRAKKPRDNPDETQRVSAAQLELEA